MQSEENARFSIIFLLFLVVAVEFNSETADSEKLGARAFFDRIRYVFNFFLSNADACTSERASPTVALWRPLASAFHNCSEQWYEVKKKAKLMHKNAFPNRENLSLSFISINGCSLNVIFYLLSLCLIDLRKTMPGIEHEKIIEESNNRDRNENKMLSWERDS